MYRASDYYVRLPTKSGFAESTVHRQVYYTKRQDFILLTKALSDARYILILALLKVLFYIQKTRKKSNLKG